MCVSICPWVCTCLQAAAWAGLASTFKKEYIREEGLPLFIRNVRKEKRETKKVRQIEIID